MWLELRRTRFSCESSHWFDPIAYSHTGDLVAHVQRRDNDDDNDDEHIEDVLNVCNVHTGQRRSIVCSREMNWCNGIEFSTDDAWIVVWGPARQGMLFTVYCIRGGQLVPSHSRVRSSTNGDMHIESIRFIDNQTFLVAYDQAIVEFNVTSPQTEQVVLCLAKDENVLDISPNGEYVAVHNSEEQRYIVTDLTSKTARLRVTNHCIAKASFSNDSRSLWIVSPRFALTQYNVELGTATRTLRATDHAGNWESSALISDYAVSPDGTRLRLKCAGPTVWSADNRYIVISEYALHPPNASELLSARADFEENGGPYTCIAYPNETTHWTLDESQKCIRDLRSEDEWFRDEIRPRLGLFSRALVEFAWSDILRYAVTLVE